MAELFMRCVDPWSGCNLFLVNLMKSLCMCKPLPLNYMETFIQKMACLSSHLERNEKDAIRDFVSKVAASDQSCIDRQDIFTELCNTIKHLWSDNKVPMKIIRVKTFELISLLAKVTLFKPKNSTVIAAIKELHRRPSMLSPLFTTNYLRVQDSQGKGFRTF